MRQGALDTEKRIDEDYASESDAACTVQELSAQNCVDFPYSALQFPLYVLLSHESPLVLKRAEKGKISKMAAVIVEFFSEKVLERQIFIESLYFQSDSWLQWTQKAFTK